MLLPEGYKVVKADNGKKALEILNAESVQVVLMDILMPGLSGFDVLKEIRENKNLRALPVILLTALRDKDNRLKGLELGADDYISKPFDLNELRAKVNSKVKLGFLRTQLNERAKLIKVINEVDEGIIVTDKNFVPVIISLKASEFLDLKEIPKNVLVFLNAKYNDKISADRVRTNYILKQGAFEKFEAKYLSLSVNPIEDAFAAIDSYIFVIKKIG